MNSKISTPKLNQFNYKALFILIFTVCLLTDIILKKSLLFIPIILSTAITGTLTKLIIPRFHSLDYHQIIRKEGPKEHFNKPKTPSMGGIIVVPIGLTIGYLVSSNNLVNAKLLAVSFLSLGFMVIGLFDDLLSILLKRNKGLTAKAKIILQLIIGIIFLLFCYLTGLINSTISIFGNYSLSFGLLFAPIALFILLAESNATNLTDGLDGLATGCGALVFSGLAIELILRGTEENYALASFCIAIAGSWLGFLLQNKYPAKIFMGDTGSLAMGASLTGIALLSNTLWSLFIMGGIFLVESLSVIIQVGVYKATKDSNGKGYRLFLMAPLHHHFELKGKSEIEIVQKFWLITIICILVALTLRSTTV